MTTLLDGVELVRHVKEQVNRIPGKKSQHETYTMILCPFHNDNTPSGRIRHDTIKPQSIGRFSCYACGKYVKWSELAERLNLDPFPDKEMRKTPSYNFDLYDKEYLEGTDAKQSLEEEELEFFDLNRRGIKKLGLSKFVWRGFDLHFLMDLCDAKGVAVTKDYSTRYYLYLPVHVKGKVRGYIKALPRKVDGLPGYFNAPGQWSHKYGLFLYDEAVRLMRKLKLRTIVLVEGPRDALRFMRDRIPAIAILGTQSWSERKVELLEETGAEKVIICTDADPIKKKGELPPGDKAARLLYSGMRKVEGQEPIVVAPPLHSVFDAEWFDLRPYADKQGKCDPYEAPPEAVEDLKGSLR